MPGVRPWDTGPTGRVRGLSPSQPYTKKPRPLLRPSRPAATCWRSRGHGAYLGSPRPHVKHLHERDARVEADQVGERERPDRMREAEPGDRVDRLRLRDALHQRVRGLVDERHQDPVRDESREVVAPPPAPCPRSRASWTIGGGGLVGRLQRTDHLDEPQHRHRVEEVHADDPIGPGRGGGERRDRDRRRVRREDRVGGSSVSAARKISSFRPASSTTASIIRSARTSASATRRARAPRRRSAPPFSASLSRLRRIAVMPRSTAPGADRAARRAVPDAATTCAIPPPIWPAPTTRTCPKRTAASLSTASDGSDAAACRRRRRVIE